MKKKQIAVYVKNSIVFSHWREMKIRDVKAYFNSVKKDGVKKGEYCERCGILIGAQYKNKKVKFWKGFSLCSGCKNHKVRGDKENTPDIEDIERFNLCK